ncbi:hypothetical protein TUMEXPCC7403_09515 [Tumidithrix helvetica PCC 7403]|uniref:hypothetical protein n=1 Tax=Tumidithrix helvetica TaxID=3457545 RepID=UPI003CA2B5FA
MLTKSCSLKEVVETLESVSFTNPETDLENQKESPSLSAALEKLAEFAQAHHLVALEQFALNELRGYTDSQQSSSASYPSYRVVALDYFDTGGQAMPSLSAQYGSYPLLNGLHKLELHLKNGLALNLPSPVLNFLSQAANREVRGGHVAPSRLQTLLESIRYEAIGKLKHVDSSLL